MFQNTIIKLLLYSWKRNKLTLIETRKSRDIQSDNDYEEKMPYMQTLHSYLHGPSFLDHKAYSFSIFYNIIYNL